MDSLFSAKLGAATKITSNDGTTIAFERCGSGRPLILIGGAFNDRRSAIAGLPMAELLADGFAAYAYDRRGRGDSADTLPYAVQREIEDLAALVEHAGEPVFLFGHSSGAALALEAAMAGLPIAGIAVYEPPYSVDDTAEADNRVFTEEVACLLREGRNGDAAAFFMGGTGMPEEMIDEMRHSPYWASMEAMAPTLMYDTAVVGYGGVPLQRISGIAQPVLAMTGAGSPDWMRQVARMIADAAQRSEYHEIEGQDHMVPAEVVAPILKAFFGRL